MQVQKIKIKNGSAGTQLGTQLKSISDEIQQIWMPLTLAHILYLDEL